MGDGQRGQAILHKCECAFSTFTLKIAVLGGDGMVPKKSLPIYMYFYT